MNTATRNLIIIGVVALVVGGGAGFFGGMQFQKSQTQTRLAQFTNGNGNGMMRRFGNGANANGMVVRGQVISVSNDSMTVKLANGSTKIIILGSSTAIGKTTTGSMSDITEGSSVTVFGSNNTDGSVTAQNVQVGNEAFGPRPSGSPMPQTGTSGQY